MAYTKYSTDELKQKLRSCLNEERYIHSLGVMEMAVKLAGEYNLNREKAEIAGLLHDCAKCLKNEELIKYSNLFEDCEKISSKTWHAPAGAIIAQKEYDINDEEILSAVRWHTIGRKNMSDFEKIIFLADKIEHRTREAGFREKIENVLNSSHNLDLALLKSFKLTIKSLLKRSLPVCYQTIDVYNSLIRNISGL